MARPPSQLGAHLLVGANTWSPVIDRLASPSHAPCQVVGRDPAGGAAAYRLRLRDAGGQIFWTRLAIGPADVVRLTVPAEAVLEAQAEGGPTCLVWAVAESTAWDAPWPVEVV